jgi:hypothetical protein
MYRKTSNLEEERKTLLLKEVSRRSPYHTLAVYNDGKYIGEIIEVNIEEEIITLRRKIEEGNVYERVFIEDLKLILKQSTLPELITFSDVEKYDREHIDFCNLINLGLAVEYK